MLKKLLIALILFSSCSFADVFTRPETIENIVKVVPKMENIDCRFKQEKYFKTSNTTLKSGGNFSFKKDKGITFYTAYPIKSTASYNSSENKEINDIILALSNKKYNKIKKDFNFFFEDGSKNWLLGLKPKKSSQIKNYLTSIEIEGDKNDNKSISKMIIETNNSKTTIWFYK